MTHTTCFDHDSDYILEGYLSTAIVMNNPHLAGPKQPCVSFYTVLCSHPLELLVQRSTASKKINGRGPTMSLAGWYFPEMRALQGWMAMSDT